MKPNDRTAPSQTAALAFEFDLQHTPEKVWRALSLTPTPTGTRLSLVQSGFTPDQKRNFGGARYGWTMMGGRLVELLDALP